MKNPWKKLLANVKLSGDYGSRGGSAINPKNRANKTKGTQSTKRHLIEIDWVDLEKKFNEQNGKCFWFGIPVNPQAIFISYYPLSPSVDRIDNNIDYVYNNIVICCRLANLGRSSCSAEDFAKIILEISNHGLTPNFERMNEIINNTINKEIIYTI